jgi:hypothetical protein
MTAARALPDLIDVLSVLPCRARMRSSLNLTYAGAVPNLEAEEISTNL